MKHLCLNRLTFFIVILLLLSACKTGPVKVGLLMHDLNYARWVKDKDYIIEKVEELGGEVILKVANSDQQTQNRQAQQLLEDEVDVIIVVPVDQNESAKIVEMANEEDVKVIAYDRLIKNCSLDYYVGTNAVRVGEVQAEYMSSIVPKGNYALIVGDEKDNNSLLIFLGQMNVLQNKIESRDIRIIYSEFTNSWTGDEGYIHTQKILELRDSVDVILTGSDVLVYGINRALDEAGLLGKVKVVSQDAELKVVQNIAKELQTATVYKPLKNMASKAAELAIDLAKGNEIEKKYTTVSNGKRLVPSYQLEPILVNKSTISSTVIADGYLRSEEIYQ